MNKKPEFDFANPVVTEPRLRNVGYTTECHTCGGGTGQAKPCDCAVRVTISPEGRAALEADKANTRRNFVSNFVAERIKAGTWPDSDVLRLVMLGELIDAWERRNEKD